MYKRFEAETLKQAHAKVKMDLGPDAVILSQREVRSSGLTGILGKKMWQVVAFRPPAADGGARAVPNAPAKPAGAVAAPAAPKKYPVPPPGRPPERSRSKIRQSVNHLVDEPALPFSEFNTAKPATTYETRPARLSRPEAPSAGVSGSAAPRPHVPASPTPADAGLENPVMRLLLKEVRAISDKLNAPPAAPGGLSDQIILPGVLPALYQRLVSQEIPQGMAVDLMNDLCDRTTLDMNNDAGTLEALEERLTAMIPVVSLDDLVSSRRPRIVFLAGPSGVGKTTTLAKIATLASRDEKMKIAFITIDTMRVAAAEQLKSYADLISADIEIVMSEDDFVSAVNKQADKDLILVDTPGKNPCSPSALSDFTAYLKRLGAAKQPSAAVLLVLSAATKLADLMRYTACYQTLNPAGIIFTKIDETNTYGSILPVLTASKLPMVFLTCGPEVPEDIEPASARRMARRILGQ